MSKSKSKIVLIDVSVHAAMKRLARRSGRKMHAMISEILRAWAVGREFDETQIEGGAK
jgi:hypothetical protein